MATTKKRAAEIQAGIIVLLGLTVLGFGLFWVSGGSEQFTAKVEYTIYLPNAAALKVGNEVRLDGRRVGKVSEVRAATDSERPAKIGDKQYGNFAVVKAGVYAEEKIPVGSGVEVSKSITGTVTLLFYSGPSSDDATEKTIFAGRARADFEKATDEAVALVGLAREAVMSATAVIQGLETEVNALQFGELRAQAKTFLERANRFAERLDQFVNDVDGRGVELVTNANSAAAEIRDLSKDLRRDWKDDLKPRAETVLDEASGLIKESRPTLRSFLQKIDDAGTLSRATLVSIQDLMGEMKGTVAEARPHLVATLRSARKGMADFQDAAGELKTSPWKLLNKVDDNEIEAIFFYDAAKRYMDAARDVRSSVDDLRTLERLGGLDTDDAKGAIERATKRLDDAVARMKAQESDIQKALKQGK
jgi:hypothetical protein